MSARMCCKRGNAPANLSSGSGRYLSSAANRGLLWAGVVVTALMMLAPSLTGHARAAAAEYRFTVFSDWLHMVAASVLYLFLG